MKYTCELTLALPRERVIERVPEVSDASGVADRERTIASSAGILLF